MPRTNYWVGVAIIVVAAIALVAFLSGRTRNDSPGQSNTQAALSEPAVGADGVPEVVVTARRNRPDTVALSEREVDAAASTSPIRAHHR
jgi:hypothetical protein